MRARACRRWKGHAVVVSITARADSDGLTRQTGWRAWGRVITNILSLDATAVAGVYLAAPGVHHTAMPYRGCAMEMARAENSLQAARSCLARRCLDSAASRASFAMFQAAVCALEAHGVHPPEWSQRALHAAFADVLIRRRQGLPALLAGALPSAMEIRHAADDRQPGPSQRQVHRAVMTAEQFLRAMREVLQHGQDSAL